MVQLFSSRPTWALLVGLLFSTLQQIQAYRPVQHCKIIGEAGHYSACAAITQHYNTVTGVSDLYLRYHWFRYRNSKNGWHAFALGQQMDGALMFIMYGDPNTPSLPMTVDVRSSDGHSPPHTAVEMGLYAGHVPKVEVVTAVFEEYEGEVKIQSLNEKPTHVGIAELVVRGYEGWSGYKLSNTSTSVDMLWSSNFKQDMANDFSHGRAIDMHQFGLGFGFLYVDMLNAATPTPMFGPIDELGGLKGVSETRPPDAPTAAELAAGAALIAQQESQSGQSTPTPIATEQAETEDNTSNVAQTIQQPAGTLFGKTLRDWMWHLHGLLMTLAYLALYPLGTYMIRNGKPTAFNSHWTVQALATVAAVIGSGIGYVNSYAISVKHQYIGIFLLLAIAAQIVLGWRHHVEFMATKRKGWKSKSHIILGRVILPLGYVNIILGMLLRQYGWFTIGLTLIFIVLEFAWLAYVLLYVAKKRSKNEIRNTESGPSQRDEAEEYFQLDGDDDLSDNDEEQDAGPAVAEQARREAAERLRRLDKV